MFPVFFAGVHVQAVQEAAEIGIEQQPVVYRAGGNRAADVVELPDASGFGDVAALGGIDRVEVSDSLAVLGVLPVGDEHFILPEDWCGDHLIACLRPY